MFEVDDRLVTLKDIEEMEELLYNEYLLRSAPANDSDNIFFELDENSAISF